MKVIHIDSSILGENSVSRSLSAQVVTRLRREHTDLQLNIYDLAKNPLPHLSADLYAAQAAKTEDRTPAQQQDVAYSEKAMSDFLAADLIVIGAPMYNFGISSQLKTWIDHVAVAGKTFRYTADGPVGLAGGKRVIVVSSRGGFYGSDTAQFAADHQEKYLTTVLGFLGITDIEFLRAEGVALGPDARTKAIDAAVAQIERLTLPEFQAA